MSTKLEIESFEGRNGFSKTLRSTQFEEFNVKLFRKTLKPVEKVLKDAGMEMGDVDDVSSQCFSLQQIVLTLEFRSSSPVAPSISPWSRAYGLFQRRGILLGNQPR